jgi:hypothetical protein
MKELYPILAWTKGKVYPGAFELRDPWIFAERGP